MRSGQSCFLLAALAFLSSCGQQASFDSLVPQEEAEFAKRFLSELASGDFAAGAQRLDPALLGADASAKLQEVGDQFPDGPPTSVQVVGSRTINMQERTIYDLTLQYQYAQAWLLANLVLQQENGNLRVTGVHVNRLPASLQELNRFTLAGKDALHYIVLALAVAIPLFIVTVLVVCARTTVPRRKWLWYVLIGVGVVQLSLNWTDGAWNVTPIGFQLLGAGFSQAGPAAPWVLTVALPLGALVFLFKRRSWARQPVARPDLPAPLNGAG